MAQFLVSASLTCPDAFSPGTHRMVVGGLIHEYERAA
jgi:hypothetical protein